MNVGKARYVLDRDIVEENIRNMRQAYEKNGIDDVVISFSVKTNPSDAMLQIAKENGLLAEIVSPHEYELAKEIGFADEQIVYNGVIPDPIGKMKIALSGGIVNVDNAKELIDLEQIARQKGVKINVGLRVNIDIGNGLTSRFGVDYENGELREVIRYTKMSKNIEIVGLHSHVYKGRGIDLYKRRVDKVVEIAKELNVKYIDFGSNMYGPMDSRLKAQFADRVPTFDDYASVIAERLNEVYQGDEKPMIIVEPGTPLVANAMYIEAKVVNVKTIKGKTFVVLNCSKFDMGFMTCTHNVPMDIVYRQIGEYVEHADFVGYTCMEDDIVYSDYTGWIGEGDTILLQNIGAYSVSVSNRFIETPLDINVKRDHK